MTDAVDLLLTGKQTFAYGGPITVIAAAPYGVSSATRGSMSRNRMRSTSQ